MTSFLRISLVSVLALVSTLLECVELRCLGKYRHRRMFILVLRSAVCSLA